MIPWSRCFRVRSICAGCLGGLLLNCLLGLPAWAQPPEEEEEAKPVPVAPEVPKVPVTPKNLDPAVPPQTPSAFPADLRVAAEAATHPAIKQLFEEFAVPRDNLIFGEQSGIWIRPIPGRWQRGLEGVLKYVRLQNKNFVPLKQRSIPLSQVEKIVPYEELFLEAVKAFLAKEDDPDLGEPLTKVERLAAAETGLAVMLNWHVEAVRQKQRRAQGWDPVLNSLRADLRKYRLAQIAAYTQSKGWDPAEPLIRRLETFHAKDPEVGQAILRHQLTRLSAQIRPNAPEAEWVQLRTLLERYQRLYSTKRDQSLLATIQRQLRQQAERVLSRAEQLAARNQAAAAYLLLDRTEKIDPTLGRIQQVRQTLKSDHPILYVGMAGLPKRLSPATAFSDADWRGVELIFESLVELDPAAKAGQRYRPVLAESLPEPIPLGRAFRLREELRWSNGTDTVDARDVRGTLEMLRVRPHTRGAAQVAALAPVEGIDSERELDLILKRGTLDPLAAMSFKILPARRLRQKDLDPYRPAFLAPENLIGSGPYRYQEEKADAVGRISTVFQRNPHYTPRGLSTGIPSIQEIRFFDAITEDDLPSAFLRDRLHLLLDVPSREVETYRTGEVGTRVDVVTCKNTQRIELLAINHRVRAFQTADLRRGLAYAVDRSALLDAHFRASNPDWHHALTGPFPPESWATPNDARPYPGETQARALLNRALPKEKTLTLSLHYPQGDPAIAAACQAMAARMAELSKPDPASDPRLSVTPEGLDPELYYQRVFQEHDFELAYTWFDYPNRLFHLNSLFDRNATGTDGRNYMGYLGPNSGVETQDRRFANQLAETLRHRDFYGHLQQDMHEVHRLFNDRMPFIPLWQRDRHLVISRKVTLPGQALGQVHTPDRFDPKTVFQEIEGWRLNAD